ncbi:MAG: type II secretion system protein N [Sphingomonas sp.]|nr:type II secretion system protein N [Sphingomonas sp.]
MFPHVLRVARMRVRWIVWTLGIALLAMLALFPLRLAIAWSDLDEMGFAARQVGGTIWYGRLGDLQLRSQPIGTLEVTVDPAALLVGTINMRFGRIDGPEGPLTGNLVAGFSRGIKSTSGRIAATEIFAPVPVGALELKDVTVLFRDGQCSEASGQITPVITVPLPGVRFDAAMAGTVECDGERARVELTSPSGAERIDFHVQQTGQYRARMTIRSEDPIVRSTLAVFGFRPTAQGLSLSVDGRL